MDGRKKVKLAFIERKEARRISLKNLTRSFLKKVEKFSILYGVQAFRIFYNPEESGKLAVWPTDELEAQQVLNRYIAMPAVDHSKNMLNQETYLKGLISKMEEEQKIQRKRLNELELAYLVDEVHYGKGLPEMDIIEKKALSLLLKKRLRNVTERLNTL
ncbi:Agamous-like MADS-box protein AGL80, partial [Linum grandiflorum]